MLRRMYVSQALLQPVRPAALLGYAGKPITGGVSALRCCACSEHTHAAQFTSPQALTVQSYTLATVQPTTVIAVGKR
jgi:hypothetical protein